MSKLCKSNGRIHSEFENNYEYKENYSEYKENNFESDKNKNKNNICV
jgi:hypothetical protein